MRGDNDLESILLTDLFEDLNDCSLESAVKMRIRLIEQSTAR